MLEKMHNNSVYSDTNVRSVLSSVNVKNVGYIPSFAEWQLKEIKDVEQLNALESLIKARQNYSKSKVERISNVRHLEGGIANDCYANAIENKENLKNTQMVSGWVVQKCDPINQIVGIIQHWWNKDADGHFDSTPGFSDKGNIYVSDFDIALYSTFNFEKLKSSIACSLMYEHGIFSKVLVLPDTVLVNPIRELRTELLFNFYA